MTTAPVEDKFRVAGRSRLVEEVSHRLRELILTHRIEPGAKLVQTELSERMGVSRTPLREAIRLLEQDGLVRVSNGNRTVEVVTFTPRELAELYEVREVIDGLAARLLARRGLTEQAEAVLSGYLRAMVENIFPLRGEAFFTSHLGFHTGLIEHCGNSRLRSQLPLVRVTAASLRDEFPKYLRVGPDMDSAAVEQTIKQSQQGHEAILAAIRRRDEDAAELAARDHIRCAFVFIPSDAAAAPEGSL